MYELREGTQILIYAPHGKINGQKIVTHAATGVAYEDTAPWKATTARWTQVLDKEEVIDYAAWKNNRDDVKEWQIGWIKKGYYVLHKKGVWALVKCKELRYMD